MVVAPMGPTSWAPTTHHCAGGTHGSCCWGTHHHGGGTHGSYCCGTPNPSLWWWHPWVLVLWHPSPITEVAATMASTSVAPITHHHAGGTHGSWCCGTHDPSSWWWHPWVPLLGHPQPITVVAPMDPGAVAPITHHHGGGTHGSYRCGTHHPSSWW